MQQLSVLAVPWIILWVCSYSLLVCGCALTRVYLHLWYGFPLLFQWDFTIALKVLEGQPISEERPDTETPQCHMESGPLQIKSILPRQYNIQYNTILRSAGNTI